VLWCELEAGTAGERRDQALRDPRCLRVGPGSGGEPFAERAKAGACLGAGPVQALAAGGRAAVAEREGIPRPGGRASGELGVDQELDADVSEGAPRALGHARVRELAAPGALERTKHLGVVKHPIGVVMQADARTDLDVAGRRRRRAQHVGEIGQHGTQNECLACREPACDPSMSEEIQGTSLIR